MKITVDRDRCVGAGMCAVTAGEVFEQHEEDGRVVLRMTAPPEQWADEVEEAEHLCPSRAITVDPAAR
ncbi:ferredoxin [Streptomyces tubercidicus]|uniref:Ferredoxin n=1 Tax=Streptomyces tubercidicus TaxID=47759 RepID=A0A640V2H5_9ACTN|nr:ferredoxin [Streptomyces tubercidicus]WAU15983.1 ferredoxin [Streptomyces tubercidicus]GFE41887.1 ferredoxin [Streptomyces tubercidicus]